MSSLLKLPTRSSAVFLTRALQSSSSSVFSRYLSSSSASSASSSSANSRLKMATSQSPKANRFDTQIALDHREIETAYKKFKLAAGDRQAWANEVIRLVSIHSVAEELAVYPVEEKKIGKNEADHLRSEHLEVKKNMAKLEKMKVTDEGYDVLMDQTISSLMHHVQQEETNVLPKLVAALSQDEMDRISSSYETSKSMAPSRPHPAAPDKGGIAETMAGMMSAPLDAAVDATKDFPAKANK